MGVIRKELHSDALNQLSDRLRALAHPARLAILQQIALNDECICTDLSRELHLAQATVSQHLRVLKDSGIIKGTIEGNSVCYCIDQDFLQLLLTDFVAMLSGLLDASAGKNCGI
jgi:DNA-binding transcriptional ArsR family regulator